MKLTLMVFPNKIPGRGKCIIRDPKLYPILKAPDPVQRFFKILFIERSQEAHENHNYFSEVWLGTDGSC